MSENRSARSSCREPFVSIDAGGEPSAVERRVDAKGGAHALNDALGNLESAAADRAAAIAVGAAELLNLRSGPRIDASHLRFIVEDQRMDSVCPRDLGHREAEETEGSALIDLGVMFG